ncbi:MAG: AAA family ATPase [Candidatus Brocadiia bacterium]
MAATDLESRARDFARQFAALREAIGQVIVGHERVVDGVLTALYAGGHCLLEGVPGLGKTLLVRSLAGALDLAFARVQFTPDLMPADIIGTNLIVEDEGGRRSFRFQPGPLFANVVLADEVNRATPKTQSALLEAMQERTATVGRTTHELPSPFFVLATQNPLEMEGTYPLPEAQLDRFLFKLLVRYSNREELNEILRRTTEAQMPAVDRVVGGQDVLAGQELARQVVVADHVRDYAARLVLATHPGSEGAGEAASRFVRYGASPRGAQALLLAGKVRALASGRYNVSFADIRYYAAPALRHRLILNFEGEAEGVSPDAIIDEVAEQVPTAPPS